MQVDEVSTLEERIQKSEQDIAQSDAEQKEFEIELDGVGRKHAGRRFAYRHERQTIHERKIRREGLVNHRNELKVRIERLKSVQKRDGRKELVVARDLAVLRTQVTKAEESQSREYAERPQLPMVLGRQLNQVKGIREQLAMSRDTIRETLVGSKFEILKNESEAALLRAKAMHKMNHEEWKSLTKRRDLKVEVELGESQLHSVVGRLKEVMRKQQSTDLQGAVQKWWQNQAAAMANFKLNGGKGGGEDGEGGDVMRVGGEVPDEATLREKALALGGLRKVNVVHEGWLDWWSSRDQSQTAGIQQWNVENVILGPATMGVIQGRIVFPKHGLWKLQFTVTKADELASSSGDPHDFVVVRLGTSAMSLALVGKYHNVRAPGEPGVRYQIEKEVTGQRVSFRFELASSSESTETHMMITRGRFKQMTPPPLEQVGDDPKHVLSSFVKMQRVERKQGKARGAILLTELIKVEKLGEDASLVSPRPGSPRSPDGLTPIPRPQSWFDTEVVNGFQQRFDRKHLAQFLRDELKREMSGSRKQSEEQAKTAELIRVSRGGNGATGGMEDGSREREQKEREAEEQRLQRERERAKRVGDRERKKKNGNKDGSKGGGNSNGNGSGDAKKWPRFGTKEDGHEEEGEIDPVQSKKMMEMLRSERGAGGNDDDDDGNGNGPSTFDAPPDLFAAGLDDEDGSTPYNTDVLMRPHERDLLLALRKMRAKREGKAKRSKRKLTEEERRRKEVALQDKLDRSERTYLLRKRCGIEIDMEQARELVGQRLEIYFSNEARWRLGTVVDMRAASSDGGQQMEVMHAVKYYGAEGAPTIWEVRRNLFLYFKFHFPLYELFG